MNTPQRIWTSAAACGISGVVYLAGCTATPAAVKSSYGPPIHVEANATAIQAANNLPTVRGGDAVGKRDANLQAVAIFDGPAMPVGVAVSKEGRTFLCIPRWLDPVKATVVELKDGKLVAFPDEATNAFDGTNLKAYNPADHLIAVQAIVFDAKDRLWILDPGCINFGPAIKNGPKLWCYDINKRARLKTITFPNDVAKKTTALNDVRFDLNRGAEGTAYITDSGAGGIIVVDLATGESWRHLDGDPSVLPDPNLHPTTEGEPLLRRQKNGEVDSPDFRSDGIALSPDARTLYYDSIVSHKIYAVPTDLLANRDEDEQTIHKAVHVVAEKPSGNDGMLCDAQGRIYTADNEDNAIRRIDPATGKVEVLVQDARLIWPDTLAMHGDELYFTVDQLPRQSNYHFGKDERQPPYPLFKIKVDGSSQIALEP